MPERLQKVLATYGVASRRRAEEMIAQGHVTVNGRVACVGQVVDVNIDSIMVNGEELKAEPATVYVALHKPVGYVSSVRRTHGEPTVLDLVHVPQRIFPVGRLDKDTSGLLLLTNDGDWANLVTHPRYEVEKEYEGLLRGRVPPAALHQLESGVQLPDGTMTAPARVEGVRKLGANTRIRITVIEGKKRQIRHMATAVGHPVEELRRIRIGPIQLGSLELGRWCCLSGQEVEAIRENARRKSLAGGSRALPAHSDRRTGGSG